MKNTQQTSQSKSILFVDDDLDTCEMFQVLLGEYEFTSAQTLDEAGRLIENHRFDLYIFDNWMPGGSGIQLCQKVRSTGSDKPIIFVSGVTHKKDIQEAINSGANKYLTKPCEPDLLKEIVKELIS